jgi:single-stranded-DNA-specific exonuclease
MVGTQGDGMKDAQAPPARARDPEGFLESCDEMKRLAFSFDGPLIVHHYDADGLSSGAIVASAFLAVGKRFRRECIKKLDDNAIERLMTEKEIIFVDLGGGNRRVDELKDVLIIDHHQTEGIGKPQANPMLHGLDGGGELSASGTAFCVFRERADLGIVGAVGDMQSPLTGMNRWVLERGVESGEVLVEEDLRLYGRYCRPIVQFLAFSDDPYVPGISYREDKVAEMLRDFGIIKGDGKLERTYADLSQEEKRTIASALAKALISSNRLRNPSDLIGESYVFPKRKRDETYEANEFSTMLNACGRHSRDDIGVRVCLGEADAYEEAKKLLLQHRRMLRAGIEYASGNVQDLGRFYFLDGRGIVDENIIGTVCGMCLQQVWTKPILGIALGEDGTVKVSGRSPKPLVAAGLNLGELMKKATEELGGAGGGHAIAAGASIPGKEINRFLLFAGEFLRR